MCWWGGLLVAMPAQFLIDPRPACPSATPARIPLLSRGRRRGTVAEAHAGAGAGTKAGPVGHGGRAATCYQAAQHRSAKPAYGP